MEEREKSERSYRFFRRIYDFSMSTLILGIGLLLLGAKYFKMDMVLNIDNDFRLIFGTMCMFYGGFRLFRAVKQDY
ncbi:MAG: hypothetical protein ACKOWO_01410 [Sediminibacterium sp.]|jgi:hypothetical protein